MISCLLGMIKRNQIYIYVSAFQQYYVRHKKRGRFLANQGFINIPRVLVILKLSSKSRKFVKSKTSAVFGENSGRMEKRNLKRRLGFTILLVLGKF